MRINYKQDFGKGPQKYDILLMDWKDVTVTALQRSIECAIADKKVGLLLHLVPMLNDTSQIVLGGIAAETPAADDGSVYDFAHGDLILVLNGTDRIYPLRTIEHPLASMLEGMMNDKSKQRIFAHLITPDNLNQIAQAQSIRIKVTCSRGMAEAEANDLIGLAQQLIQDINSISANDMIVREKPLYKDMEDMVGDDGLYKIENEISWRDDTEPKYAHVSTNMRPCKWNGVKIVMDEQRHKYHEKACEYFLACEIMMDHFAATVNEDFDYKHNKFWIVVDGEQEIHPYKVSVFYPWRDCLNLCYYFTEEQLRQIAAAQKSVRVQMTCYGDEEVGGAANQLIQQAQKILSTSGINISTTSVSSTDTISGPDEKSGFSDIALAAIVAVSVMALTLLVFFILFLVG